MPTAKPAPKSDAFGERIKALRKQKNLSLDQLANETGLSTAFLKKIESGEVMPPVGALLQISRALEVESGFFLEEKKTTKKSREKAYSQRTQNYAYTTLSPGARHKHLKAFKILVDPKSAHKGVGYQHEGEEFVYVLSGSMEVTVGDHVNKLGPGDSLHFNSGIPHHLKNTGDTTAELLVVVYTP